MSEPTIEERVARLERLIGREPSIYFYNNEPYDVSNQEEGRAYPEEVYLRVSRVVLLLCQKLGLKVHVKLAEPEKITLR